eukprot:g74116.t1
MRRWRNPAVRASRVGRPVSTRTILIIAMRLQSQVFRRGFRLDSFFPTLHVILTYIQMTEQRECSDGVEQAQAYENSQWFVCKPLITSVLVGRDTASSLKIFTTITLDSTEKRRSSHVEGILELT